LTGVIFYNIDHYSCFHNYFALHREKDEHEKTSHVFFQFSIEGNFEVNAFNTPVETPHPCEVFFFVAWVLLYLKNTLCTILILQFNVILSIQCIDP
jgi:hypothetical protein